ncbi:TonB-dependent receptor [Sulfurimonas sp.]|uniref:TonB-dependent receptor n=1 Tax=Sulfurimonas sp. TaxID=2022749 RepID=UPI002B47A6FC|nr:TonB-dependent receptor [Sulfurimonas sp.]
MKKQNKIVLSLATALILTNSVYAQETTNLGAITVTANKVEENIKSIPQSITVISDVEIEQKGIKSVKDLIKEIPNLTSSSFYSETVNFRGINTSHFTNTNPVVIYIDGIPYSDIYGFDKAISNVLRVEILRGPQGAIYGKDSIGGVINIVTKEPTNQPEGSISAQYGTDNFQETSLEFYTPIIANKLFLGFNGIISKSDGYAKNSHPNQRDNANENEKHLANIKLIYNATDNLSIKFSATNDKDTRYGIEGGITSSTNINDFKREDFKNVSYDEDIYAKIKSNAQALNITYDFDDMTFTSLTTHKKLDTDINAGFDYSNNSLYDNLSGFEEQRTKNISQEFRLSKSSDGVRWLAGLYYETNKQSNDKYGGTFPAFMMGNPFGTGVNVQLNAVSQTDSTTLATFGQVVIPFSNAYELTLGGRYQQIKKKIDLDYFMLPANTTGAKMYSLNENNTWNTFLPKVALSYKVNNDLTSYFSVAKGYLPGGYNKFADSGEESQNMFDAQKSINYELGIRGDLLDKQLYMALSVFYMDIKDIHVFTWDMQTGANSVSNAGEASSKGLEVELNYTINDDFRVDSSLGIIEAKYDKYKGKDGNKIEMTPSHTANIGLSYSNINGIYGRFDVKNQGKMYFDDANTMKEDSYTTANIKAGYLLDDWDIYAYVKNITDKSYITTATQMPTGKVLTFGEGRFVGVGARYSF